MSSPENPVKFGPGNAFGNSGRPKTVRTDQVATPAEVRALLMMVLDQHTADAMVKSLRKKICKANIGTLEFLFDRIIGRPAVNVHHEADGALLNFVNAWQQLVVDAKLEQAPPLALENASEITEGEMLAIEADDDDEDDETDNE